MTVADLERVRKAVIRRYQISAGLALEGVKIELSSEVDTAAVVGKKNDKGIIEVEKIVVNPEFFDRLSFSERVFVLAHEALHIALRHFARAVDKPEKDAERKYQEYCQKEPDERKREAMKAVYQSHYHKIWNIATDACINAFLRRDGFTFPENVTSPKTGKKMQFVDIKDGLIKSAEKIYDDLVRKEEEEKKKKEVEKDKKKSDNKDSSQNDDPSDGDNSKDSENKDNSKKDSSDKKNNDGTTDVDDVDIDDFDGFDSHDQWTGNDKNKEGSKDKESSNGKKDSNGDGDKQEDSSNEEEIDEEDILNKELQRRKSKSKDDDDDPKKSFSNLRTANGLADYVPFKPVLSWKRMLVGTLEKDVEVWGNRRSSRFSPNARIEERTVEDRASVEVILDVSGSISVDLLRGFLLQLYPILEALSGDQELTLKVGTFSDSFSGFQIIRSKEDIAKFNPRIGGGTRFEVAATSFTPDPGRRITKIVFTDGVLGYEQKTRVPDIVWIVFGDKMDFTPLGGRIIKVSEKEYKEMINTSLMVQEENELREEEKIKNI